MAEAEPVGAGLAPTPPAPEPVPADTSVGSSPAAAEPAAAEPAAAEPELVPIESVAPDAVAAAWDGLPLMLQSTEGILRLVGLVAAELVAVLVLAWLANLVAGFIMNRVRALTDNEAIHKRADLARRQIRLVIIGVGLLLGVGIVGLNGWLVISGKDALQASIEQVQRIPAATWIALAAGAGRTVLAVIGAGIGQRLVRAGLRRLEQLINRWDQVSTNDESLRAFITGLERALINALWLLVVVYAFRQLQLPEVLYGGLISLITIYVIIAVGILVIRINAVIVDTLDGLSARFVEDKVWKPYYDQLRPLVPLLRRCLEYALWVGIATLVVAQLAPLRPLAGYGPNLLEAIGIFFLGRVAIEVGKLFIDRTMTGSGNLTDTEIRRRETVTPLFKSVYTYVCYFVVLVLVLAAFEFEVMPLLAGAGVLGVVIGLGAQPLINDVVSGFFILFEHQFLVGDFIAVGDVRGEVESIDFRTTRLRDVDGCQHVFRNGDLRHVVNYSRDYTFAVVEVRVPADVALPRLLAEINRASAQLQTEQDEVIEPTAVRGITDFGQGTMTVRTITKVQPGCHGLIAMRLRAILKEICDQAGIDIAAPDREVMITR